MPVQKKFSQLPQDSNPTVNDFAAGYDADTTKTKRILWSDLINLFFNNIPTGNGSPITRSDETQFDHVASGGVWSGDNYGVNRNASMSAAVVYINGRRITISAVSGRTFTASKDTYIDILDNADGTGTLVYTEVSNNAASPALAANSIRIGIIITGATTIANSGSVNQGEESKVLPIASSIAYSVTDSLGNLICSRDPERRVLGYRQILSNVAVTTIAQVTGLSAPVIVPTGRKVKITHFGWKAANSNANRAWEVSIWEGTVGSGTRLGVAASFSPAAAAPNTSIVNAVSTPSSSSKTYNIGLTNDGAGTITLEATSTAPAIILVELV